MGEMNLEPEYKRKCLSVYLSWYEKLKLKIMKVFLAFLI